MIELNTSVDINENNNSGQYIPEPNKNEQNSGYDNNDGNANENNENEQKESLISS